MITQVGDLIISIELINTEARIQSCHVLNAVVSEFGGQASIDISLGR